MVPGARVWVLLAQRVVEALVERSFRHQVERAIHLRPNDTKRLGALLYSTEHILAFRSVTVVTSAKLYSFISDGRYVTLRKACPLLEHRHSENENHQGRQKNRRAYRVLSHKSSVSSKCLFIQSSCLIYDYSLEKISI